MTAPSQPDDMADGLRAAFGTPPSRPSILPLLRQKVASQLDLHLHDAAEASDAPVKVDDETRALRDPTGRYQVIGEIGRGGVGIVYKGRDQDLGRDVAMKVLKGDYADQPDVLARFVEEAQIGGQLQHPGIVPVYDLGLHAGERPYFAMKLVKGETLAAQLLRRETPGEDRRRFLGIFEQVCQTMAYAHARFVVHRDLKPANVMIGAFGEVQVVDWGMAKVLQKGGVADEKAAVREDAARSVINTVRSQSGSGSHSVAGSMMGTPAYMPPEQALGDIDRLDQRSDVFGLGAILCEILTGAPPYRAFDGDVIRQAATGALDGAYRRLQECGADAALVELCTECLARSQQARPGSAAELAERVGDYLSSVEERAREAQIHAAEAKVRARSTLLLAGAAVLVLGIGGGGYLYLQHEAQARRGLASQRVAAAVNEANVRLGEARTAGVADLGLWTRALDAAVQAGHLAEDPDVTAEQRSAVTKLLAQVESEQRGAQARAVRLAKDTAMLQRLLDARMPIDDNDWEAGYWTREARHRDEAYAAAFADYLDGRDLSTMPPAAAAQSLAGDITVELATAIDHWVFARRYLARRQGADSPDAGTTTQLQSIATALDPDPWRNRLRAVLAQPSRDRDTLLQLHADADLAVLPAVSLDLLAAALNGAGARSEAQAVLHLAGERYPTDFSAVFGLARLHEAGEEWQQASYRLRTARALRPDMREVRHRLGIAAAKLGDHSGCESIFRELVAQEPENGHWLFHLGGALRDQGRLDDAIASFRQATAIAPRQAAHHHSLGHALGKQGRLDEAIASYRQAIALDARDVNTHGALAEALRQQGKLDDAMASFRQALALDPKHAGAHNNMGRALSDQGKHDEAVAVFRQAVAMDPSCYGAHNNLGNALRAQGKFDEAIVSLRAAIALDPNDCSAHINLGLVFRDQGRHDEAIASFRQAIALDPQQAMAHVQLGIALSRQGQHEEAIASYRQAIARDPRSHEAHSNLAIALHEQGRLDEAIASYRQAIALHPMDHIAHANLGSCLYAMGRFDEASSSYQQAIAIDPRNAPAQLHLGLALGAQGRHDDAIASYRQAIALDPKDARAHFELGSSLRAQGRLDEAIASFRQAIALAPQVVVARLNLGTCLFEQGKFDEAIASYQEAIALDPQDALAHGNLGTALSAHLRFDEALQSYRRAEALCAGRSDAASREMLGSIRAEVNRLTPLAQQLSESLAIARGERDGASASEHMAAAELVYQRRDFALASRAYGRALAAFPELLALYPHRYNAACAAALAGCNQGNDAGGLTAAERIELREQARAWLSAEVTLWREELGHAAPAAATARQRLAHALKDADFVGVRGEAALAGLPDPEAAAWRVLWQQVSELLASKKSR